MTSLFVCFQHGCLVKPPTSTKLYDLHLPLVQDGMNTEIDSGSKYNYNIINKLINLLIQNLTNTGMSGPTRNNFQSISYFSTDSYASKQSSMQPANTTQHSLVQFYRQTFISVKITITPCAACVIM